MRNFFLGVISAALAAILAYAGQWAIDQSKESKGPILLEAVFRPPAIITKHDAERWFPPPAENVTDTSPPGNRLVPLRRDEVKMTLVEISNTGDEPLRDLDLRLVGLFEEREVFSILSIYHIEIPGGDEGNIRTDITDGVGYLHYDLLNSGESDVMWVASEAPVELVTSARQEGLDIDSWDVGVGSWRDWREDSLDSMAVAGGLIIAVLLGAIVQYLLLRYFLRKDGYKLRFMRIRKAEGTADA